MQMNTRISELTFRVAVTEDPDPSAVVSAPLLAFLG